MNRFLYPAAFFAGLAALCWVGSGYVLSNPWALAMTVLIGAFYLMGALELQRFRRATGTLSHALAQLSVPPQALGSWLEGIDPQLQNAVRLRVDGERVGLPGPVLTPYLAGLLVLLGMLGTFLGMVVTLKGTALALDGAASVEAVRVALSAPVKGLGLAFGTSVAGVAASAMLGLMSAMCRRERLQAAHLLDAQVAGTLHVFSQAHRREESFKLLQRQAETMPALVNALQTMMATMEQQAQALNTRLAAGQEDFHKKTEAAYAGLAASVDRTLRQSLADSARAAGDAVPPMVEAAMADIARQTSALHESVSRTVQEQLDGLSARFEAGSTAVAGAWQTALVEQQRGNEQLLLQLRGTLGQFAETFEQRSAALLESVGTVQGAAQEESAAREQQRLATWTQALEGMAASLQREWQQAGAQTLDQQRQICHTLEQTARDMGTQAEAHARSTIAEIARLVQTASEAPRAAAEVITELRQHLSDGMARDNTVLEERGRIMQTLGTLLDTLNHATTEQRAAIDALVASSAALLEGAGTRFTEKVDTEAGKMVTAAAQVTASAVEVASLGEAFGFAVRLFGESNDKLLAQLKGIEGALDKSLARSDEQLAYYVAQAREIIDLSIMSQKQIIEDLQQISAQRVPATAEA